ncbi:MAG TPA: hypothetical protein VGC79_14355 [Polyangiaceae bacterium]
MLHVHVIDLSQNSFWRARLFNGPFNEPYHLDVDNLNGVPVRIANAIRRRNLRYDVTKVPANEAEPWLSEGGLVVFRFRAREFPSVTSYSGNSPTII